MLPIEEAQTKVAFEFGDTVFDVLQGSRLETLCKELKEELPKLVMGHKRALWWHWIAHVLITICTLGLNRRYIGGFTTTSKDRVDWSDKRWNQLHNGTAEDHDDVWITLGHEYKHLQQFAERGTLQMVLIWLFPPVLFCYGRAILIERPGYIESLRRTWEVNRRRAQHPEYKKWWVRQFTGAAYGFMWVLKSQVEGWFDTELARLRKESADGLTGA